MCPTGNGNEYLITHHYAHQVERTGGSSGTRDQLWRLAHLGYDPAYEYRMILTAICDGAIRDHAYLPWTRRVHPEHG